MVTKIQLPTSFRTTGTNLVRAKSHNHRVVLEVIRTQGPLSRADIARVTLLSRQTVQNIVGELQEFGLVKLGKTQKAHGRGHPGVKVEFCAEGGFSLGVHLDQFSAVAVLSDLGGNVHWEDSRKVAYPDPKAATEVIRSMLGKLSDELPEQSSRMLGIGLALPGPFNKDESASGDPTALPLWGDPDVAQWLTDELGLPVVVENDASAASVGEHLFGIGKGYDSFAYIYFGLGLGAGLHLNGSLYSGKGMNAGEIGHMVIVPDGIQCSCGNRGCLERYVSLQAIYDALGVDRPTGEAMDMVERLFRDNDPRILAWLDQATPHLKQAINILECLLDVDVVIIGGRLPDVVFERMFERLDPLLGSVTVNTDSVEERVVLGATGPNTTALGAAALAVFAQISPQVDTLLKC